ncbi:hypothetical protein MaudCBS49596_000534 [Microsporum audouinii]
MDVHGGLILVIIIGLQSIESLDIACSTTYISTSIAPPHISDTHNYNNFKMKLSTLPVAVTLCGLAASLSAMEAPLSKEYDFCARRPEFDYCEITGKYVVCERGKPTFYTCDSGCKSQCFVRKPCVTRCDNGKLSGPPDWAL